MTNKNGPEKDVSLDKDETTNPPSAGKEVTRRRPTLLGHIKEDTGAASTSVLDETDHRKDPNHSKLRSWNSPSGYFTPTRLSQARRNDKIGPLSRQGSNSLQTSSIHDTRPISPLKRSNSAFRNYRNDSTESGHLSHSVTEQRGEAYKMRSSTFNLTDSLKFHENNVTKIFGGWNQGKDADLGGSIRVDGYGHIDEETMKKRSEELEVTKEKVVSLRQRNNELATKIENLKAFGMEHDKALEDKLPSYKAESETWKQNYDALSTKYRKIEEQIKAQNHLESETSQNEATEIENKKLRATVVENQNDIAKMKTELKKKDNELVDMTKHAANIEEEALGSDKKLKRLQKLVCDMGKVIAKWIQVSSSGAAIEPNDVNQLIRNYADDAETKEVLVNAKQLLNMFVEKNESLERQLEDKKYEITNIKKAIEEQSQEEVLLTPGLMLPTNLLYSSDKTEALYKEERAKRIAAEEKLKIFTTADKQDSQLQQVQQDLHSQLTDLQKQFTLLTQQAQISQHLASEWESEVASKQSELDLRTSEFQSALDSKDLEINTYISSYHSATRDRDTTTTTLHQTFDSLTRDYASLKTLFDSTSLSDAKKSDIITRLQRKIKLQTAYMTDMQQAMYLWQKLPLPQDCANLNHDDDDDDEFESESKLDDPLSPQPPRFTARPRKVPRYMMSPAMEARREKVKRYKEELRVEREKVMLGLVGVGEVAKGKGVRRWR